MLEKYRPDALILDLTLSVIDGLTVLRKTSFRPHTILALTTLASQPVLDAAAQAGVQDVVLLPCAFQHLMKHLNALIEKAPSAGS